MARNFKWVRKPNMYGIRNWTGYELFIEGRPNRVALIEQLKKGDYYTALVDFNSMGGNGVYYGYDKKKHTITTFAYLDDCKKGR